jgi:hypothetical protein
MISGEYRDGVIYPIDPVPADWANGRRVSIEPEPSDSPKDIERWVEEMQKLGPALDEPGEWETFQAALDEADAIAKEHVRRQMGLDK